MDDPRRPGAVLGPKTVPKRGQLIQKGLDSEILWHTFYFAKEDLW